MIDSAITRITYCVCSFTECSSHLQVIKSWCPVCNDRPDFLIEEVVIHLQILDGWLLGIGAGRPPRQVVAAHSLSPEVGAGGIHDQGAI